MRKTETQRMKWLGYVSRIEKKRNIRRNISNEVVVGHGEGPERNGNK